MSEFRLSFPACVVAGKNRLTAEDILLLRKYTFVEGVQSADQVITMLAIHNSCPEKCPEWADFFVESMTRFIVHFTYPQGSLDDMNASWLQRMLATDGVVNSPLELELLLHVLEVSAHVPDSLNAFALDQVRLALDPGIGAYRLTRPIARQGITRHDVDYMQRILRGSSHNGRLLLSSAEIAVLRTIDTLAQLAQNHPAWLDLLSAIAPRHAPVEDVPSVRWLRVSDGAFLDDGVAA